MSNFYGINNNIPLTPFVFDKVYNKSKDIDINDGVFVGRYIFCNENRTVYQKYCKENGDKAYRDIAVLRNTKILMNVKGASGTEVKTDVNFPVEVPTTDTTINCTAEIGLIWQDLNNLTSKTLEMTEEENPVVVI